MAFSISLYTNLSDNNVVNKNLTNERQVSGTIRGTCNVVDPIIRFTGDNFSLVNYMYIPTFGRYYYINEMKSIRTGLWEVSAHCDVLMTYKAAIANLEAIIDRQKNNYNVYLEDAAFKKQGYDRVQIKAFPNSFTSQNDFVLAVAGIN